MLNGSGRLWRGAGPVRFVARRLNTSIIRPLRASRPGLLAPPGLGPPFDTSLLEKESILGLGAKSAEKGSPKDWLGPLWRRIEDVDSGWDGRERRQSFRRRNGSPALVRLLLISRVTQWAQGAVHSASAEADPGVGSFGS